MAAIRAELSGDAVAGVDSISLRSSQALMLSKQGKEAEAVAELIDVWENSKWQPDWMAQKMQVALLITNLSPAAGQAVWLSRFQELAASTGKEVRGSCCVCLEPFSAGNPPEMQRKVYITTCHHVIFEDCWEAHKRSTPPGRPVCCPECRHEIIVSTTPTVVTSTGEAVPLRPGREQADFTHAIRGGPP